MNRIGVLSVVFAAAVATACNDTARTDDRAEIGAVGTIGNAARTTAEDAEKDFINRHLADGTAEVELGKLASTRATHPDVKRFAETMVQDHTTAGAELKALASKHRIQPAPEVDDTHRDVIEKLSKLRGPEFDREYIKAMVENHEHAVDSLEGRVDTSTGVGDRAAARDSANARPTPEKSDNAAAAAVNTWAAKALPAVRHHLDEAKRLDDKLGRNDRTQTRTERQEPGAGD